MSARFTAFENEASTSQQAHYYANDYDNDGQDERIEMNVNQYPNYQSHGPYQGQQADVSALGASPYGVVDEEEENDLTDDLQEKERKNVGYRQFIYNNSEQFKPIVGGLILIMGSGIHIIFGVYYVFELLYEKRKTTEMHSMTSRCIVWSWYFGAIIGSICAGFALQSVRKNKIYFAAAVILIKSAVLLFISEGETSYCLFFSRLCGGITHGLIYVTLLVHASENATKEFREFLVLIIGALLNYSLLISVLCFFYTDSLFSSRYTNCLALFAYGICSMIIVAKHSTETVPFLLQNSGTEMDGLETVAKLKKKPIAARSVHHDYLTMRKVVNDELVYYGPPSFRSVFLVENRCSLAFCLVGRGCSILSFNVPLIVMILLFLRSWIDDSVPEMSHHLNQTNMNEVTTLPPTSLEHLNVDEKISKTNDKQDAEAFKGNAYHHNKAHSKPKRDVRNENAGEHRREHEDDHGKEEKHTDRDKTDSKTDKTEESKTKEVDKKEAGKEPERESKPKEKEPEKESKHEEKVKEKDKEKERKKEEEAEKDKEREREKEEEKEKKKEKEEREKEKQEESKVPVKAIENSAISGKSHDDKDQVTTGERVVEYTTYTHLLIFLHRRELTLVLIAWFIFGTLTVAFLYTLNLKRFIYHVACVLCSVLVISGIAHSFHFMTGIMHFALIIYFNYITIPIDLFGHGMLAEAFPITLKAYSIAVVASLEHFVHIIIIGLYMTEWFRDSIVIFMLAVAYLSHEVATNLPQKSNLTLAEARDEYQKVNLLFIGRPVRVNDRERI